ncbi:MAG: hypothetical protein Q4B95_00535 [Lonepinella koalarum]|nr:hypothetical protein [Lonepinella koalarum]
MMNKMKINKGFKTSKIFTALFLSLTTSLATANEVELQKYQQARIAVTYKGNVGDLAQQLAEKLGIGYYAAKHNSTVQIKVKQDDRHSLQELLNQTNQQLAQQQSKQELRFDMLDDKVVLALVGENVSLAPTQFIGNVVYDETKPKPVALSEPSASTQGKTQSVNDDVNMIAMPVMEKETVENQVVPEAKSLTDTPNTPAETPLNQIQAKYSEVNEAEIKKLREILAISQDSKLLAQYAKRKTPSYNVPDQQAIGLETIRSTKISTFLIFKDGIDVANYKVDGQFQEIAKVGNVVAILHRQKSPPKEILITSPDNQIQKLIKVN